MQQQQQQQLLEGIGSADRLLIVAAAGLSISDDQPNNPYHDPKSFALHYPQLAKYGYRTSYQGMGLGSDDRVPTGVKKAYTARHFLNMRFNFPVRAHVSRTIGSLMWVQPTRGYNWLLDLADTFDKPDVFCWTSNVDGCFERAGFDPDKIYTTQGEMNRYQCADARGCG